MKTTQTITALPDSPERDRRRRFNRYVFSMSLRVLCFVVAVVLHNVWSILPIVLAAVLPWIAVIIANAGSARTDATVTAPGGALTLAHDPAAAAARDRAEAARAQAYRAEQDRLRHEAEEAQQAAQHGSRRGRR